MLTGLRPDEYAQLVASVGTHRRQRHIPPVRVAQLIAAAHRHHPLSEIAARVDLKDDTILKEFLALLDLPAELQGMIAFGKRRGSLAFTTAAQLARLHSPADRAVVAKAALEHDLSKSEVQAVVQRSKRAGVDVQAAIAEILRLRPIVEQQFLLIASLPKVANTPEDQQRTRGLLRQNFARLVGANNVLTVTASGERAAVLLTAEGAKHPQVAPYLTGAEVDRLIHSLLTEESDA